MSLIKESNHADEFIVTNINNNANECQTCRETETSDRMKSIELSTHTANLIHEEKKLKGLHRRLEIRIKRFLYRTRKSISLQEKLLNSEKCAQHELMIRHNLQTRVKPGHQYHKPLENLGELEEKNLQLETDIQSVCKQIRQIEQESKMNRKLDHHSHATEQNHSKALLTRAEDRLHRMNMEMSTICSANADLRTDIQRMVDDRRRMIEEYNQLINAMQQAMDESRQLTSECSDSYANRRNLVARMESMRDQHERDEKKLLNDIRELDRLSESNLASKNFFLRKSNLRQEQSQLNEMLAGKRSRGVKSAYTAQEFRRFFRAGFGQDFVKEKTLSRTVETFLDEREQSFSLFEYAVDLINELNHLRDELEGQRKYLSNLFSEDNVKTFSIRETFSQLERSVDEAETNVQALAIAKNNGRNLLIHGYQLIENFYHQLDCDQKTSFTHLHHVGQEPINDRNVLLYLASIESRIQQLLPLVKVHRKSGGRLGHHHHLDETTISWRIDHRHPDHSFQPVLTNPLLDRSHPFTINLAHLDPMIPMIPEFANSDEIQGANQSLPSAVVDAVLQVYNECDQRHNSNSTPRR